ncbi:MAG: iron ABC transporter permease [Bacteroidaceae bacterium]|nr:iron ABC transporter permease [Bacteroidaceae bacterium]
MRRLNKNTVIIVAFALFAVALFISNLFIGSVDIPFADVLSLLTGGECERESWRLIVLEMRLPQAVTALLAGAAISVAGLLLQTLFNNPLAGPEVLGINSGAGLGVAVVMLLAQGMIAVGGTGAGGSIAILSGAFAGAMLIMAVILFLSSVLRNKIFLLIAGVAVGYLASSLISILNYFATAEGVHSYMIWGMGSFSAVSMEQIPFYAVIVALLLLVSLLMTKPLNALLLGDAYAMNLGINVKLIRGVLLSVTALLTAVVTAFCGPVAFIGLAVPHISRLFLNTANHKYLLPGTLLAGSSVALLCNLICQLPGENGLLPLGAITPLVGAPVIIYVILKNRNF